MPHVGFVSTLTLGLPNELLARDPVPQATPGKIVCATRLRYNATRNTSKTRLRARGDLFLCPGRHHNPLELFEKNRILTRKLVKLKGLCKYLLRLCNSDQTYMTTTLAN